MVFGDGIIGSFEGVQQGDPMGPMLFAATMHSMVERLQSPLNSWFLDDGTLAGNPNTVEADLRIIREEGQRLGLQLSEGKCEYACHNFVATNTSPLYPCRLVNFTELTLLGAPLGEQAKSDCLAKKIESLMIFAARLLQLQPHQAFYLLRNSMALPRLMYVLRSSNLASHELLRTYDEILRGTLEDLLNVRLGDNQWRQATQPVKHGGLGVRSSSDVCLPAFISSAFQNQELSSDIAGIPDIIGLNEAVTLWLGRSGAEKIPERSSQDAWDLPLIQQAKNLIINAAVDEFDRARIMATASPMSSDWLHALPAPSLGLMLNASELRIAISLRLGAKLVEPHQCVACGQSVDGRGTHGLSCRSSAGRFPRHFAANDLIKRALATANVPSMLEPTGLTRRDGKRPDGLTLVPWSRGRCLVWDFTCSDTLAQSHVHQCSLEAGSAAKAGEERKLVHYTDLLTDYVFAPISIETLGSMGPMSMQFVQELSKHLIATTGDKRAGHYFRQRLGITVQRGNALAVMGSMERGQGLLDGLELDDATSTEPAD